SLILAANRTQLLNEIFLWITRLGEEHIFIAVILVMLIFSYKKAMALILAGLSTIVFSFLTKLFFSQPRPLTFLKSIGEAEKLGYIDGYSFHDAFNSFPSGHTFSAFALFTTLALNTKPGIMQFIFAITAIAAGFSRIYLGQHFLCDVVFGAFLGLLTGLSANYVVHNIWFKNKNNHGLFNLFNH
ncbi:MAG TPA: hypothetical protein DCX89_01605, partial [Saprospirales bacterium]|nr:hypothetical protein [Saprospirales bacterium]